MVAATIIGVTALCQLLFVFLPLYAPDPFHSLLGLLHITFALWLWINAAVNYYMALFVHPGVDAMPGKPRSEHTAKQHEDISNKVLGPDVRNRTTDSHTTTNRGDGIDSKTPSSEANILNRLADKKNGMLWTPARGNYCTMCKFRVAYMDHHCPYTGGCFGLNNYSYFYLGLCYGVTGAVYAFILTAPYFWKCDIKYLLAYLNVLDPSGLETEICDKLGTQSRAFIPVAFGLWLAGMMLLCQTVLLLTDVSTLNVLKNSSRVPILRFMKERIRGRKFLQPDSRLSILLLSQRAHWYHYLIPVMNMRCASSSHSGVYSV